MEKKNNGMLVGILIGIVLTLLVVGCLFATGTIGFKATATNDNGQTSENKKSIKNDESKDYVYDAEYKYENKYTFNERDKEKRKIDYYGISVDVSGELKDLKVPYININSDVARNANKELKDLYIKYAKEFDKCVADFKMEDGGLRTDDGSTGIGCSQILTYRTYQWNNILSIVVIDSETGTTPFVFNYKIYNFDLSSGNKISYNDMLVKLKYDQDSLLDKIKNLIKVKMSGEFKNDMIGDLSKACIYKGKEIYDTSDCYEITYKLFQESINNNTILYLTDNDGNLNIIPILYIDFAENGGKNHYLIKVTK